MKHADETNATVRKIMADYFGLDVKELTPGTRVSEDLDADSVDAVEIIMLMEEQFNFRASDEEAEAVLTVQDLIELVRKKTDAIAG